MENIFKKIRREKAEMPEGTVDNEEIETPIHEKIEELEDEYHELKGNTFIQLENQYLETQFRIDNLRKNIEKALYDENYDNKELLENMISQYKRSIDRLQNLKNHFEQATEIDTENVDKIKERMMVLENKIDEMNKWIEMITIQKPDAN